MWGYIPEDKLMPVCEAAAKKLNVSVEEFMRAVYDNMQSYYDDLDVRQWLEDQGYDYTDDDVGQILDVLRSDWDADRGTWSNIESAYYNCGMNLPYKDDEEELENEAEGPDDDDFIEDDFIDDDQ